MTSYIKVQRICRFCGKEFTAQTTTTKCCSTACSSRYYKARKREEKVERSNEETKKARAQSAKPAEIPVEDREFLNVSQVAKLIGCSRRNVYYLIDTGRLKATNIMEEKTIIRRADLDALLNTSGQDYPKDYPKNYPMTECYNMGEAQKKFGMSGKALYDLIRRNNIPKFPQGKFVYVPKELLDKIFN